MDGSDGTNGKDGVNGTNETAEDEHKRETAPSVEQVCKYSQLHTNAFLTAVTTPRGSWRRKAVGGPNNLYTHDTILDDSTTRTGLESIVFAKQEQFTLSS